jgi:glycerophosphoryl diester phosphodiesterase
VRTTLGGLARTAAAALVLPLLHTPATAARPDGERGAAAVGAWARAKGPLVIAHRGACGYRPEHTLEAYELAARIGADYIEPDLVSTKDGVLVARHENEISRTTDVASRPEFADRQTTKTVDGAVRTGWFTEDFTLAELKMLRAVERIPEFRQENTVYDGRFQVPTFQEVLDLRKRLSRELGREIGVYPETKHATYFAGIGLELEAPLAVALRRSGLNRANAPVYVQSFELTSLEALHDEHGVKVPLVFLTSATGAPHDLRSSGDPRTYADLTTNEGLRSISSFVDALGPEKSQVIPRLANGALGTPTTLVDDAHAAGLRVHAYTFRAENAYLPTDYRTGSALDDFGRAVDEQVAYLSTGIDGLFTDHPDIGVLARAIFTDDQRAA